ncbi:hypothetical protein TeGR_g15, partial [Tetraparma gracilis]
YHGWKEGLAELEIRRDDEARRALKAADASRRSLLKQQKKAAAAADASGDSSDDDDAPIAVMMARAKAKEGGGGLPQASPAGKAPAEAKAGRKGEAPKEKGGAPAKPPSKGSAPAAPPPKSSAPAAPSSKAERKAPRFPAGAAVAAPYRGSAELYPGRVTAAHPETNTADVAFDDGDAEKGVACERMKALKKKATPPTPAAAPRSLADVPAPGRAYRLVLHPATGEPCVALPPPPGAAPATVAVLSPAQPDGRYAAPTLHAPGALLLAPDPPPELGRAVVDLDKKIPRAGLPVYSPSLSAPGVVVRDPGGGYLLALFRGAAQDPPFPPGPVRRVRPGSLHVLAGEARRVAPLVKTKDRVGRLVYSDARQAAGVVVGEGAGVVHVAFGEGAERKLKPGLLAALGSFGEELAGKQLGATKARVGCVVWDGEELVGTVVEDGADCVVERGGERCRRKRKSLVIVSAAGAVRPQPAAAPKSPAKAAPKSPAKAAPAAAPPAPPS